ncbi:hypothetical protein ACIP4Y_37460 [Streptomyces sp. NPDC088810]|uniref:hypothetical protein n=1 Tax=Streptomyces sp. NPDC088810 TaxID=3365904 RepID=UPI00380DA95E
MDAHRAQLGAERLHGSGKDADPLLALTEAACERFGLPAARIRVPAARTTATLRRYQGQSLHSGTRSRPPTAYVT